MKLIILVLVLSFSLSIVFAQNISNKNPATRQLYTLFDAEWQSGLENSPETASYLGDKRYNNRWNDLSLTAINARHERQKQALTKLKKIARTQLSVSDQLNYDLFQKDLETAIEQFQYGFYLKPISQAGGIQTSDDLANFLSFETVKDYEDWLSRLNTFPAYMEQTIALMREGKAKGILGSQQVLDRVPAQIDKLIVKNPEQSTFYNPFKQFAKDIPVSDQVRLQAAAKQAIIEKIIPSYQRLKDYFTKEYFPACYKDAGIWQMPNGQKAYESLTRSYTTTNLTPPEIHEKGLAEVARIRTEMEKIKVQVGFKGDLQDFFKFLRTDKQFFYKTPEELLNAYRANAKRIDPNLVKIFRTLPRMPYGVIPIPDNIAPDTTTAYYNSPAANGSRPGYYYVNLYKPEVRPKWEMMALSLHESVPGHHLQLSLQQELGEVPNFRKYGGYTAFIEGWGLYAESLGDDMGLYDDPYSKFGQLTYEMWRAVRLVVDTGMHYFKWDRARAIKFFKDNAAKTDQDIVNEIDRYISDPGQALAYKIGELKLKELRARSKQQLGDKFDLKEFHDVVLLSGAVPLDILERNVNEWLMKKQKAK